MTLRPLIDKLNAAFMTTQRPESFSHDVATLDQAVREEQKLQPEKRDADLGLAKRILLNIWRMDLYCRFDDAPKCPPDNYLCRRSSQELHHYEDECEIKPTDAMLWKIPGSFEGG